MYNNMYPCIIINYTWIYLLLSIKVNIMDLKKRTFRPDLGSSWLKQSHNSDALDGIKQNSYYNSLK